MNSVHKLVLDVFSREECIPLFYTNDLMVLIDIIARQLCDLGPGLERYTYLEMAHLVLARSGYDDHLHRLNDLKENNYYIINDSSSLNYNSAYFTEKVAFYVIPIWRRP